MKSIHFLLLLILISLLGCSKEQDPSSTFTKEKLTGYLQKGPFVNGSSLTVFELDERYAQTGKSFNTQILDNTGAFELSNISTISNFVKIRADGFYFNEVANSNSQAPLTLYALSNLALSNTVNVNLLTSLEVPRAEYLLSSGSDFTSAKKQAQHEVLKIFSITRPGIIESELLDISQNGDDNAILLAISVILQGYRTEAELSQLLGDINTDIRTDGILNSQATGSLLINDIKLINLAVIRNNLSIKYQSMGITATIPDFEKYVAQFIDSTSYTFNKFISYPYILDSKENLLYDSSFYVTGGIRYSFGAYLPIGTSIRVILKPSTGYNWNNGNIGFYVMENSGWIFDNNPWPDSTIFSANGNNQTVNIPVEFGPPTSTDFLIYENNAAIPARIKTIKN
jgi:hypothetical protein